VIGRPARIRAGFFCRPRSSGVDNHGYLEPMIYGCMPAYFTLQNGKIAYETEKKRIDIHIFRLKTQNNEMNGFKTPFFRHNR
jgi:hypothetical protein